jgi:uncharacterized membrane protein YgaE (UPF0421/DUF939 family)
LLYIGKCITATVVVFILSMILHYPDYSWCLISAILVLTPESSEALPLALTRIKANFIGGSVSIICLLVPLPMQPMMIVAMVISILGCQYFKLMTGSRAAIAAVIIIMLHGQEHQEPFFWITTFKRLAAVIIGCIIGLLVTMLFHRKLGKENIAIQTPGNSEH